MSPRGTSTSADLKRLIGLFMHYKGWLAAGIALSLVTVLANVGLMAVSGHFIASMALAGLAGTTMNYFTPAALIRLFAILRTVGRYLERLVTHEATFRLLASLRVWFYRRIEPLAPAGLASYRGADLANRIQTDIDTLDHVYLRLIVPVTVAALGGALIVAIMAVFSVPAALVTALFLALAGVALPVWLQRRGKRPGQELVASRSSLRNSTVDGLLGMAELRVYGAAERHAQQIAQISGQNIDAQRQMNRLSAMGLASLGLAASLAMWLVVLLILPRLNSGELSGPSLPMLALFTLAAFEAVMPLPQAFQSLGESLASARRLFDVVDAPPAVPTLNTPSPTPATTGLHIRGLSFRYAEKQPWVLRNLDLDLPEGARLALVGSTGSGKTSLVHVLMRFWDFQDGAIELGGYDLRDYRPDDLNRYITVLSQDAYIFNSTVLDNLLLARPDALEAEVVAACRAAQIHDFIMSLPQGYFTELGEAGMLLSGGQARRIAIARAFLKDTPILVLDEPTEGLDEATAKEVLSAIGRLMDGRSVLLISHHIETLAQLVDAVVEMEDGHIVSMHEVVHD